MDHEKIPPWVKNLENAYEGVLLVGAAGRVLFSNSAAASCLGKRHLLGRKLSELFENDLKLDVLNGGEKDFFTWSLRPDQKHYSLGVRCTSVSPGLYLLYLKDLTEDGLSKKVVEVLARATETLGSSLDLVTTEVQCVLLPVPQLADWAALVSVGPEGEFHFSRCHHHRPEMQQQLNQVFVNSLDLVKERFRLGQVVRRGEPVSFSLREGLLDGLPRDLDLLCLPLHEHSEVRGVLCLGFELPRRFQYDEMIIAQELASRMAQALENARLYHDAVRNEREVAEAKQAADQSNKAKTTFLAAMSHEIRSPLTAILGFSDLLLSQTSQSQEQLDFARKIRDNGDHLLRLIDDILNVSKIESGKIELELREVSFSSLLSSLYGYFQQQALSKNIDLRFIFSSPVPEFFTTDSTRLRQILSNLIGNALKFTTEGQVTVDLRYEERGGFLVSIVTDTGPGLESDQIGRLFSPFSQAHASHTRRFGGTGLGLMLSRQLARLLDGEVELLRSEPGRGSEFQLTLPVKSSHGTAFFSQLDDQNSSALPLQNGSKSKELENLKLLLVDDSDDNRFLVGRVLKTAGAEVSFASCGREGVSKALADTYSVILMDIQMPDIDGMQATAELRRRGVPVPIIALTACALASEKEECLHAGCNDHIAKPVNREHLIATILKWSR